MKKAICVTLLIVCLVGFYATSTGAKDVRRPAEGPLIIIHAPHPRQFEFAMDEAELDWSRVPGAKGRAPARQASPAGGATIVEAEGVRARAAFAPVVSTAELQKTAAALQAANPGAEAYLVLYEPGRPKSKATQRLLTREVALVLEAGEDPQDAIAGLHAAAIRPVSGVSGGYVVDAQNPIAALDLAEALRQRTGVRSAYPLLKRYQIKQ